MSLVNPSHLKRYAQIAALLARHGRRDLVLEAGLDPPATAQPPSPDEQAGAESLADELEALGPTFVKMGQLLSTRSDLLPPAYLAALARLQDRVEPFGFDEVSEIVTSELGVRLSKAFSSFEEVPIAAASLGQVHRAALRDGRAVAVKVQRPGVRERVRDDLDALDDVAGVVDTRTALGRTVGFRRLLDEFRRSLVAELDYRREAENLRRLGANLSGFQRLVVPEPVEDYTTSRVLTMGYVSGRNIDRLSPLALLELDGAGLADELFAAYLQQMMVDGLLHADPHPGNVFVTDDGRLALLDLGMAVHLAPGLQERLLKLLLAVGEGDGEAAAAVAFELGQKRLDHDADGFRRQVGALVTEYAGRTVEDLQMGRLVLELSRAGAQNGVVLPQDLALLGKALLNLDQVGRRLDPTFDPNAAIRRHAGEIMSRRLWQSVRPGKVLASVVEMKQLMEELPERANRILDLLASNRLRVKVDAIEEEFLMEGLQKIANRITLGLVLAALVIGAALLTRIETAFQILGYPGLAMIFFLAAAFGGIWLMVSILSADTRSRRSRGPE